MNRPFATLLILLFPLFLFAQEPEDSLATEEEEEIIVKPELNPDVKWGVKMGTGMTILIGKEPNNPRPTLYLTGGLYNRTLFKKNWAVQTEVNFSLKGSNFDNNTGEYTAIRAYYLEVPVMLLRGLNEKNTRNIVAGLQYSRLLNGLLYIKDGNFPEEQKPELNKNDLSLIGGVQFHTPFVGFQLFLKYGLLDVNQGLVPSIPPANTGKSMHNFTFEVALIF